MALSVKRVKRCLNHLYFLSRHGFYLTAEVRGGLGKGD